jgi:hypothetical protein
MIDADKIIVPETIDAGDEVTIEVPVYNVGSKDQSDVVVKMYSKTLGISTIEQAVGDIDSGDDEKAYFTFTVPASAVAGKNHELVFEIYDEDDDIYELKDNDGDEYDASFSKIIKISGEAEETTSTNVVVDATLEGQAIAGNQIVVKAVIVNAGSTATFSLIADGYNSWADKATLSQSSVTLSKGQSTEVTITLDSNADIEGEKTFNLQVMSGSKVVLTQPISVEVESAKQETSFSFGNWNNSWYLWAIGAFNVLLVIAIIVIVVRMLKK